MGPYADDADNSLCMQASDDLRDERNEEQLERLNEAESNSRTCSDGSNEDYAGFCGLLPPALNRAKAQHACVLRPPERGGAGCQFLIKTPMTGTPPSTCLG